MTKRSYPFDVFTARGFPGPVGELIERVHPLSMFPPFPWGQWTYARVFAERCRELPGDVLEAGVGIGGMSIFLGLLMKQLGEQRHVFGVDTFDGLPAPDGARDNPYFREGLYAPGTTHADPLGALFAGSDNAGLECFQMRLTEFGAADRVTPVQGLFEEALPQLAPDRSFSFVHIDADLFESVYGALHQLYDRVDEGGVIAIDDFFHPGQGPLRAAAQFFNERGETPVYNVVFPYSVFVIKEDWGRPVRAVDGNAYSLDWLRSDRTFVAAVRSSVAAARGERRARRNAKLLLETLREPAYDGEIYDYWRSLEQFWASIDTRPEQWAIA
jgi:macrocin-O-methyltransferase TylF-like protien